MPELLHLVEIVDYKWIKCRPCTIGITCQGPTLTLVRLPGASASVKKTISGKLMADLKSPNGQANIPTYLCSKYCQLDHCAMLVALSTTRGNIDKSQAKY